MIRPITEDRARFAERCSKEVCAAAHALRDRFKELGIRAPFTDDDVAWCDLADAALRAALKAEYQPKLFSGGDALFGGVMYEGVHIHNTDTPLA